MTARTTERSLYINRSTVIRATHGMMGVVFNASFHNRGTVEEVVEPTAGDFPTHGYSTLVYFPNTPQYSLYQRHNYNIIQLS